MPSVDELLEKSFKKKFKKSSYRPWNYMEEIKKEEDEKKEIERKSQEKKSGDIKKEEIRENVFLSSKNDVNSIEVDHKEKTLEEKSDYYFQIILRLSGHQKSIFEFILDKCLSQGELSTGIIKINQLISLSNTSFSMINTSIQRLIRKGLIVREKGKRGRGGFYCFRLLQEVQESALKNRKSYNHLTSSTVKNNEIFEVINNVPLSMHNQNIIPHKFPKEWEEIDIGPLEEINFSRTHLIQLYKHGNLDPKQIQDSIYYFSYDLKYNNKRKNITKSSPIGYFIGILKKIGIYSAPDNYESPRNMALKKFLEKKKQEKLERENMIKELLEIDFQEWESKLTSSEKDEFLPDSVKRSTIKAAKTETLKLYFRENIWPDKLPKEIKD